MKVRMITSGLGAIVFFLILLSPKEIFYVANVLVAAISIFEVYSVCGLTKKPTMIVAGCLGSALCALFGMAHLKLFEGVITHELCFMAVCAFILYLFAIMVFDYKHIQLADAAKAFFAALFPALLLSYIMPLRGIVPEHGRLLVVMLFLGTWAADGGAYFIGINFGKHKLCPVLSPKKSVEGFFGGILGSVLGVVLYALLLNYIFKVECNEVMLVVTGIGCALLGPIGDIATSAIKREMGVKDYGNILPGHGGVTDRFDSILATAPFVYFMQQFFNLIG